MCPVLTQRHAWGTKWVLSPVPRGPLRPPRNHFLEEGNRVQPGSQALATRPSEPPIHRQSRRAASWVWALPATTQTRGVGGHGELGG